VVTAARCSASHGRGKKKIRKKVCECDVSACAFWPTAAVASSVEVTSYAGRHTTCAVVADSGVRLAQSSPSPGVLGRWSKVGVKGASSIHIMGSFDFHFFFCQGEEGPIKLIKFTY